MTLWLNPYNAEAFEATYQKELVDKYIKQLDLLKPNLREVMYVLAYFQVNGVKLQSDTATCCDYSMASFYLIQWYLNPDDTDKRDAVFNYLLTSLDGLGITLDLNSLIDTNFSTNIITKEDKVLPVDGVLFIPPNVTHIDINAYADDVTVKDLQCSDALTVINASAFENAVNLTSISFNKNLSYIGANAFSNTALQELKLPINLRTISAKAFAYNTKLSSVSFNEGLMSIEKSAFIQCRALTCIKLPSTCGVLGESAFAVCNLVREYDLNRVREIGDYCFYDNRSLVELTIPDSCIALGKNVFDGCVNLKTLHLPAAIPNISKEAFVGLPKDCKIIVHTDKSGDAPIGIALYLSKLKYEVVCDD